MNANARGMLRKRNQIAEQFVMISRELIESIAWHQLPDNARRVLDRLQLEHMRQGGAANGDLVATYADFEKWGLRRASIPLALRQCVHLGFLQVTRPGGRSISNQRWPSRYRLTYVNGAGSSAPRTDDWRRIKTTADARAALVAAEVTEPRRDRPTRAPRSRSSQEVSA